MSAQLRLTLSDEQATTLDGLRGPATRTAYAAWLLDQALEQMSTLRPQTSADLANPGPYPAHAPKRRTL